MPFAVCSLIGDFRRQNEKATKKATRFHEWLFNFILIPES